MGLDPATHYNKSKIDHQPDSNHYLKNFLVISRSKPALTTFHKEKALYRVVNSKMVVYSDRRSEGPNYID